MSEKKPTIEERYKNSLTIINRTIKVANKWKGGNAPVYSEDLKGFRNLLDDLMSERGKKKLVNLDEIFPKEIMEKAHIYLVEKDSRVYNGDNLPQLVRAVHKAAGDGECTVAAYTALGQPLAEHELARVRVRLGLTVEIVEEK